MFEMTLVDEKGAKTVMQILNLRQSEKYTLSFERVQMGTTLNKVNYFSF